MKPSEVAHLLGVAPTTVRSWSQEFGRFLSASGAGGAGRHRDFTDVDLRVLAFIQQQKRAGHASYEIQHVLTNLQDADWEGLPYLPERPHVGTVPMVPEAAAHAALDAERRALLREIAFMQQQTEELKAQLAAKDMVIGEKQTEILDLTRRLSEVETELRFYREGRLTAPKPPEQA